MSTESGKLKNTFCKEERLCNRQTIDKLFTEGTTVYSYPFRFVFTIDEIGDSEYPIQVVFSVPRKIYKKAVDRNLIRRRTREAYRIMKEPFYHTLRQKGKKIALMVIYTSKEIDNYNKIEFALQKGLKKMVSKLEHNSPQNNHSKQ